MGNNAGVMTDALTWAGTFHGIGARLLRDYADQPRQTTTIPCASRHTSPLKILIAAMSDANTRSSGVPVGFALFAGNSPR